MICKYRANGNYICAKHVSIYVYKIANISQISKLAKLICGATAICYRYIQRVFLGLFRTPNQTKGNSKRFDTPIGEGRETRQTYSCSSYSGDCVRIRYKHSPVLQNNELLEQQYHHHEFAPLVDNHKASFF